MAPFGSLSPLPSSPRDGRGDIEIRHVAARALQCRSSLGHADAGRSSVIAAHIRGDTGDRPCGPSWQLSVGPPPHGRPVHPLARHLPWRREALELLGMHGGRPVLDLRPEGCLVLAPQGGNGLNEPPRGLCIHPLAYHLPLARQALELAGARRGRAAIEGGVGEILSEAERTSPESCSQPSLTVPPVALAEPAGAESQRAHVGRHVATLPRLPICSAWTWPLSRLEKKVRIAMIDQRIRRGKQDVFAAIAAAENLSGRGAAAGTSGSWDWPLTTREKKVRLAQLDRRMTHRAGRCVKPRPGPEPQGKLEAPPRRANWKPRLGGC